MDTGAIEWRSSAASLTRTPNALDVTAHGSVSIDVIETGSPGEEPRVGEDPAPSGSSRATTTSARTRGGIGTDDAKLVRTDMDAFGAREREEFMRRLSVRTSCTAGIMGSGVRVLELAGSTKSTVANSKLVEEWEGNLREAQEAVSAARCDASISDTSRLRLVLGSNRFTSLPRDEELEEEGDEDESSESLDT